MSGAVAKENDVARAGLIGVGHLLRRRCQERREKVATEQDSADLQFPHGPLHLSYRLNVGLSSRLPRKAGPVKQPQRTPALSVPSGTVQPWQAPIVGKMSDQASPPATTHRGSRKPHSARTAEHRHSARGRLGTRAGQPGRNNCEGFAHIVREGARGLRCRSGPTPQRAARPLTTTFSILRAENGPSEGVCPSRRY